MFITLDATTANMRGTPKSPSAYSRACDQCKERKVRCDMIKPCVACVDKGFVCTYEKMRKKRGPTGKRIEDIRHQQRGLPLDMPVQSSTSLTGATDSNANVESTNTMSIDFAVWPSNSVYESSNPRTTNSQMRPNFSESRNNEFSLNSQSPNPINHVNDNFSQILDGSNDENIIFPSMPIESPSSTVFDDFGSIQQRYAQLTEPVIDIWPDGVNEQTLLPWIDVYFKRLHPTIPILNRANMYCEMLLRKHHIDSQYGAMLLGLCAFAMEQPVQIHEQSMKASRSVQSRMLLQECAKMRVLANFGEEPTIEMILTSFFMFACLFGTSQHKAARHRLREAVDLAYSLGLHLPQSYQNLTPEVREQWLRTYLVLSVTERAYALQQSHSISFRGRPGVTARFMHAFDQSITNEYISSLLFQDQAHNDAISMTSLLYLMESFDTIDERLMDCWNGFCQTSDGLCEYFDRRRALQMFRAQYRVREACLSGNMSFAPSITPLSLAQLLESQQADISITQVWLLNRLWHLCFSHGLLRETSEHPELQYDFACQIAAALLNICDATSLAAMEVHGLGILMKVYDIAVAIVTAAKTSSSIYQDMVILVTPENGIPGYFNTQVRITVRDQLARIGRLMNTFRGGDHELKPMLEELVADIPGLVSERMHEEPTNG